MLPTTSQQYRVMQPSQSFSAFPLPPRLLKNLEQRGFEHPTEIQSLVIPAVARGEDVLALARTGTGKTAAFMLPLIDELSASKRSGISTLILAPTPELALQLNGEFLEFSRGMDIPTACLVDGVPLNGCRSALSRRPALVVGNPAQIIKAERARMLDLMDIRKIVMDEADTLLTGPQGDVTFELLRQLPPSHERQTLLLSATLPPEMEGRVSQLLPGGKIYNANFETPVSSLRHSTYEVGLKQRFPLLLDILRHGDVGSAIIFCSYPRDAANLLNGILKNHISCGLLTSQMDTVERSSVMSRFRSQEFGHLIATADIARGLDVAHVTHAIHFNLPVSLEDYRHCAGRAGRAGRTGESITFVAPQERWDAGVMFQSLSIKPDKLETPLRLKTAEESQSGFIDPYSVLVTLQEGLEYTFNRPGLLLTTLNRNRFYEDGREKVQMLNFLGRSLLSLAVTDLATNAPISPDLKKIIEVTSLFHTNGRGEVCARALGLEKYVREDSPHLISEHRPTNLEHSLYNLLGAVFVDSGTTDAVTTVALKGLLSQWPSSLGYALERPQPASSGARIGALARMDFESALDYQFKNSNWLDLALDSFSNEKGVFINSALLSRGHAVANVVITDLLRRGGFDWSPSDLREHRAQMFTLNDVWFSARGALISQKLQEHFGWGSETRPELAKKVLTALAGAIYSDGGYGPVAGFLEPCFPQALEWVEQARSRIRMSADLVYLQELLDDEGARLDTRLKAQEASQAKNRELQRERRSEAAKRPLETKQTENYRSILELHVQTEGGGKLQFKNTSNPDGSTTIRVLLSKKELATATAANASEASQEAARQACLELGVNIHPLR